MKNDPQNGGIVRFHEGHSSHDTITQPDKTLWVYERLENKSTNAASEADSKMAPPATLVIVRSQRAESQSRPWHFPDMLCGVDLTAFVASTSV